MQRLHHPRLDHILWHPQPDDPFDEPGADLALDAMLKGPVPPEAWKDPDDLAEDLFLGSVDIITSGWLPPEPPECPPLELTLAA